MASDPDEDPEGFPFGGWQASLLDEVAGAQVAAAYEGTDALLLGRRTYDIFAAYWPHQAGGQDYEIATLFNSVCTRSCSASGGRFRRWRGAHDVTLLAPPVAGPKGTVYLRYGLADGTPRTGDMGAPDRGAGRGTEAAPRQVGPGRRR